MLLPNDQSHLKSPQQMDRLFSDMPEALAYSCSIAEACQFSLSELRYQYPSEWIPSSFSAQEYLTLLVKKGAQQRYRDGIPKKVEQQIQHELALVAELNFADYFLTIWDIVDFARRKKILCQGRGSAANSILCYCLGITAIDPVHMDLLFERFISVERGEPPDIDVDFEHERREEVIQYVYQKYGRHRAAMVCAVITYRTKSALRDINKAFGREETSPLIENDHLTQNLLTELKGFPRHLSIHTGGFTLSSQGLDQLVPIQPARMENRTVIQWDKYDLDILGLLKVDLLSLGMLTAIRKTLHSLEPTQSIQSDSDANLLMAQIPADDPATYRMIQQADTIGVFQIESRAQMSMLPRLLPKNYYDLVIEVALVRPGPIHGDMVHPYLRRRQGLEPVMIPHPKLVPILKRTLGVPLFQEQVMKIAISLAGFTGGEADELRKAIGAWRSSGSIDKMGQRFKEGLLQQKLPSDFVDILFRQLQGFSEYGFPESHAASFALLAYVSAYLKCHYPAAFTCALLNSQPMGFYAPHTLIDDAKTHGVKVNAIDPHLSIWDNTLEDKNTIRLGWRMMPGLSKRQYQILEDQRSYNPFINLNDFLNRTGFSMAQLEAMAMSNIFVCFQKNLHQSQQSNLQVNQREIFWQILEWSHINGKSVLPTNSQPRQLSLFHEYELSEASFSELTPWQSLMEEYKNLGYSTHNHPMALLRPALNDIGFGATHSQVKQWRHGNRVKACGMVIVRQRPPTAKGTVFATLEDESGTLDLIIHANIYERFGDIIKGSIFLKVEGLLQKQNNAISLIVKKAQKLFIDTEPTDNNLENPNQGPTMPYQIDDDLLDEIRFSSHDWH